MTAVGSPAEARTIDILLVEDNHGDVRLMQEALREQSLSHHLSVVGDGEVAMRFLRRQGQFAEAERPELILLDLNLPRKDGHQVLAEIKGDPDLCSIPVVVLTTSTAADDVRRSYALHANSYVVKPANFQEFVHTIKALDQFWRTVATLPVGIATGDIGDDGRPQRRRGVPLPLS